MAAWLKVWNAQTRTSLAVDHDKEAVEEERHLSNASQKPNGEETLPDCSSSDSSEGHHPRYCQWASIEVGALNIYSAS